MRRHSAAHRLTPIPMKLDRQEAIVRVRGISYRGLCRRGPIDETPNRKPLSVHASEVPSMDQYESFGHADRECPVIAYPVPLRRALTLYSYSPDVYPEMSNATSTAPGSMMR
jgi:hypothetical protein